MNVFLILLLVWFLLTVLVVWAVVRFLQMVASKDGSRLDPAADIQAAQRVVNRLNNGGIIQHDEADRWRAHLTALKELDTRGATTTGRPATASPPDQVSLADVFGDNVQPPSQSGVQPPSVDTEVEPPIAAEVEPAELPPQAPCWLDEPTVLPPSQQVPFEVLEAQLVSAPQPPAKREPSLTISEVITSFLAAHNIRWGELVAGMLIVICSIGLVISLWNTLIRTHRVVPSLIFLAANTAIFAAGLYTLSRWRLRHTSRAMLIIATLLVPLSILAGLATAGTGSDAVALNDPVTLVSIFGIGIVYLTLLWQGGKALVGKRDAGSMVLSVAGPSTMLPLLPAAVRAFGSSAAFLVAGGSLALAAALSWVVLQSRQTERRVVGTATGRHRLLIMSVGSFALSMLIGNIAFTMPDAPHQLLRIAIGGIPALVAVSATGGSLSLSRRRPNLALTGTVISVLAIAASFVILAPAMVGPSWLWSWAAVLSGCGLLSAWAFRQPLWLPIATVATGLALLMWSPVYFQGIGWQDLPLWRRFVGGEPMLAALTVGVAVLGASRFLRQDEYRKPLQLAGLGWVASAFLLATLLSIAPQQWLGSVPAWVVTLLLALVAAASMGGPNDLIAKHSAWATIPLWLSVLRPISLGMPLAAPRVWMMTTLAIAATLALASEIARRWRSKQTLDYWQQLSASMSVAAAIVAGVFASHSWVDSATTLTASAALLWWVGVSSQRVVWLQVAQIASLGAAIVVGWGRFNETLMSLESWQTGVAPWGWAVMLAALTLIWLIVREGCKLATRTDSGTTMTRPFAWYAKPDAAPSRLLDWAMMQAAVAAIVIAAIGAFAALAGGVWENTILTIRPLVGLPAIGVATAGAAMWLIRRQLQSGWHDQWLRLAFVGTTSVLVWAASQLSVYLLEDPAQRLVLGTTLMAIGCFALDCWIRWSDRFTDTISPGVASTAGVGLVSISSVVLLATGWCEEVFDGERPQIFQTCSVAAWWISGAALTFWIGWKDRQSSAVRLSAALTPAAALLVMPLLVVDSPTTWIQWAAIASGAWAMAAGWCFRGQPATAKSAQKSSLAFVGTVGFVCSVMMILHVLLARPDLAVFGSWGGVIVSVIGTAMVWKNHDSFVPKQPFFAPLAITILSGQATGLAMHLGWNSRYQIALLASIWLVAAAASLVYFARNALAEKSQPAVIHYWHAAVMSVVASLLCASASTANRHLWLGLIGCLIGGLLATSVAWSRVDVSKLIREPAFLAQLFSTRLLGWFVLAMGGYFVVQLTDVNPQNWDTWTGIVAWFGLWIVWWRASCPDAVSDDSGSDGNESAFPLASRVLADAEATLLVAAGMLVELLLLVAAAKHLSPPTVADPMLWLRVFVVGSIAASGFLRGSRNSALETSLTAGVSVAAIVAICVGVQRGAEWHTRIMLASLVSSTWIAMLIYMARTILPVANQASASWTKLLQQNMSWDVVLRASPVTRQRFGLAMWRLCLVSASIISVAVTILLITQDPNPTVPLTIAAIALLAAAVAELAELTGQIKMKYATVVFSFLAIGMWASVNVGSTSYPPLTLAMQWLVAWVLTAAVVGLVIPKLLGSAFAGRWQPALRFGVILAGSLAAGSMALMFAAETWIRLEANIDLVSRTPVYFVASTLVALSIIATLLGILSGPGFGYRDTWRFSDRTRVILIVAAQVIGGLTWLHLHLCKSPLAHLGLRPYWPYIVMFLSFASVGITEWAKRRGDEVLSEMLRRTALYLPLIPVIGFWLSSTTIGLGGSGAAATAWTYIQGKVSYQSLLALGAVYYGGLAFLWKGSMPRVTSMILGNAALWVVLVQLPNWNFLAHPQAWLIPPAVCVLVVAHLYRDRLEPAVASGIRYAATLTIYVTSTADMLLQDIGATLWGPIILVLLALAGMTAGIVLRVRPFLYLGAIFVFIGTTSMVWHATERIDEVWPWWAFGITTGILLLAGLMAIEKNKPKLQALASSLAKWES